MGRCVADAVEMTDPPELEPSGDVDMLIQATEHLGVADNEGASLTFEGLLKRAKKKFIGHLDGPVASGEWSCCRRSRCSRARRRRRRRLSPPLLCRCHRPAASLVIATAKASTILPTLAYAADATVASHLRASTLASLRARVLALASPRAHSACAGVAACTERRAQEAVLVQRGIRQAGWRRIHRIHPRARSHASGGGMRQRCTAARHFRPQLETAL